MPSFQSKWKHQSINAIWFSLRSKERVEENKDMRYKKCCKKITFVVKKIKFIWNVKAEL